MSLTKTESYIPPKAYLYFPTAAEQKGSDNTRMIFDGNTIFDAKELTGISQFKEYAKKQNYALKPIWTDNMIVRFLYANGFKMDKTLASIKEHTTWRETTLPVKIDAELHKFLNSGLLYVHGRDNKFRPIVVFNVYQLNPKTVDMDLVIRALTFWFEHVIQDWMLPGQVENWVFIINMKGMGIAALAVQSVRKLFQYLQDNYKCRLYSLYVLNTPASIYIPWQVIKKLLDEVTVKKIQFCKGQTPTPLFASTNADQVEELYGGTAANTTQYWPPTMNSKNFFVNPDDEKVLISKEAYKNLYRTGKLMNMKVDRVLVHEDDKPQEKATPHHMVGSIQSLKRFTSHPNNHPESAYREGESSLKSTHSIEESEDEADYMDYMDENLIFREQDMVKEFRTMFGRRQRV